MASLLCTMGKLRNLSLWKGCLWNCTFIFGLGFKKHRLWCVQFDQLEMRAFDSSLDISVAKRGWREPQRLRRPAVVEKLPKFSFYNLYSGL